MNIKQKGIGGVKRPHILSKPLHFSAKKKFGSAVTLRNDDYDVWVPLTTEDQGSDDLCTDHGSIGAAEPLAKKILNVLFQRAAHNKVAGTPGYVGAADPMQAALAITKIGALPDADAPFTLDNADPATWADLSKYPQNIILEAGAIKEISVYESDSQNDLFDSIRDTMQSSLLTTLPAPVMVGASWRSSWLSAPGGVITGDDPKESFTDHEFVIVGEKMVTVDNGQGTPTMQLCLKAHLSSGINVGDGGFFYFPREIVNTFFFAYFYGLGNPNDYKDNYWNIFQQLYSFLWAAYQKLNKPNPTLPVAQVKNIQASPAQPIQVAPVQTSRISLWAEGIQQAEGWAAGTRSFKNNNPGNLKYTTLTASFGATGKDPMGDGSFFCIYPSYEVGFKALCSFLTLAAQNQLLDYHDKRTLMAFTLEYARPPKALDGSYPYLNIVANKIGVKVDQDISQLL